MNEIVYNSIGINYNANRAADSRIFNIIKDLLDLPIGSTIVDIGAGTGNYSNQFADLGYRITAVEPAEKMRKQATPHQNVDWVSGKAECIPLKDGSVNGIYIVLAIHHFVSLQQAAVEMHRICPRGPIVIFTVDTREGDRPWFMDYFPEICQKDTETFPPINSVVDKIAAHSGWSKQIVDFPLPYDLSDKNMYSAWREPERYLDAQFRQNTSGFALAHESLVKRGLERLEKDLQTGEWDKKYGELREREYFDAGFRFIKCAAV